MTNRVSGERSGVDLQERQYVCPVSRSMQNCADLYRDSGGLKIAEIVDNNAPGGRFSGTPVIGGDGACLLILNLEATTTLSHASGEFRLRPGDLLFIDDGPPLRPADRVCGRLVLVSLPQAPIPAPVTPCLIDSNDGMAAVLRGLVSTLLHHGGPLWGRQPAVISDVMRQLVGAACSPRRQPTFAQGELRDAPTRQWVMLQRSVEASLSDPALSPATVAARHGISTRHLHRVFRQAGMSFTAYVRTRRLQRCRDDLADPRFGAVRLTEIAYRWGFSDSSHFSRCFKAAFGCTAREFRIRQLSRSDGDSELRCELSANQMIPDGTRSDDDY